MPTWIECRDCGIEFRDKPGRIKCPECGARIEDDEEELKDRPRRRTKKKPKSKALLFSLIGVGVLGGVFAVVLLLLLLGSKADPTKVTVANFKKLNTGMTQVDVEKILAGSSSSSVGDMQTELSKAGGWAEAQFMGLTVLSGPGSWRRWDGVNSNVIVWGLFSSSIGGRREPLTFAIGLERLPGGGYQRYDLGGIFGGLQFPNMPQPPQFPFPR